MHRGGQVEFLSGDGDQHVDADRDPDLCLHSVLGGAVEALDAQVLVDPFKEQLDLATRFVERADGQCRRKRVVVQEHEVLPGVRVPITDAPQVGRKVLRGEIAV